MVWTLNTPKSCANFKTGIEIPDPPALKPPSSIWAITLAFQQNRLRNFQLANLSTDGFLRLPSQRASLFLRQCTVNWIISNCQPVRLKFLRLKKSWLNVQFLTLLCASQPTEGLHMFSANPTPHRIAFECFVKFSILVKYISLLFPQENPHTHFILASGTANLQANLLTRYHQLKGESNFSKKYVIVLLYINLRDNNAHWKHCSHYNKCVAQVG